MYKRCSMKLTNYFIKKGIIDAEKKAVYEYGFEILISTVAYALVFFIIAIFTQTILHSIIFFIGFFIVRTVAGGYHADTYRMCHLISVANHIMFIVLFKLIPEQYEKNVCLAMILISSVIIFVYAPIAHPNKPFIKTEENRFRVICCVYATLLVVLGLINYCVLKEMRMSHLLSYTIGTLSAAISVVAAKINIIILKKGKNET